MQRVNVGKRNKENALRRYLTANKMSYEEFSHKIGCSPASICLWVNGKAKPGPPLASKMHRVTKGEVPVGEWGYVMGAKRKMKRVI